MSWSWSKNVLSKSYHNLHAKQSDKWATVKSHEEQDQEAQNHSKQGQNKESGTNRLNDTQESNTTELSANLPDYVNVLNNGKKLLTNSAVAYKLNDKWIVKFFHGAVKFVQSRQQVLQLI